MPMKGFRPPPPASRNTLMDMMVVVLDYQPLRLAPVSADRHGHLGGCAGEPVSF
jgi:hypothetical protein